MFERLKTYSIIRSIILSITSILLLLSSACSGAPTQQEVETKPRTYYDSLDLSSPESAIHAFVDAFSRDDFPTVWLILDGSAQFYWPQYVNIRNYDLVIQTDNWEEVKEDISILAEGLGEGEHSDYPYFFDQFMLAARKHNAFLIDLTGPVTILSSDPSMTMKSEPALDVTVRIESTEEEVVFRMVQGPSEKWRVRKVIVTGGEDEFGPWAIPREHE